jgi:hypothetical protein
MNDAGSQKEKGRHSEGAARILGIKRRTFWVLAVLIAAGLGVIFLNSDLVLFPCPHSSTLLVLDDCDDDFRNPPFEDAVIAFGPGAGSSRLVTNLNTCQTIGGSRCLSVSPRGSFFVVCEIVGKHLTAYETGTGRRLWSVDGEFTAATVGQDGRVYAVMSNGTIYGERTVVLDLAGRVITSGNVAGFDIALDEKRAALWLVGKTIKKCDLQLNLLWEIAPIKWCASSVDIDADGMAWVTERDHPDVAQSTNRLLRIDPDGRIVKTVNLAWSPACLRASPSDGGVWVTGYALTEPLSRRPLAWVERKTGPLPLGKTVREFLTTVRVSPQTEEFDASGKVLRRISQGGHALELDSSDHSLWLAGKGRIYHYSAEGKKRGALGGVSNGQKYIAVLPGPIAP